MAPDVDRDGSGRPSAIISSSGSTGPLGIWHWPILSMIFGGRSNITVTEINRDEDGRIVSLEEFEL